MVTVVRCNIGAALWLLHVFTLEKLHNSGLSDSPEHSLTSTGDPVTHRGIPL